MASSPTAKQIFNDALERASEDRRAFIDQCCNGDATLRSRVEDLLSAHVRAGGFLSSEAPCARVLERLQEHPGTRLGPYRLIEMLGEGGFGAVFLAEQEAPIRRRVAVKIIKLGMDTRQVIARFEAERQTLAMMDHTNIARVFDAGATETGRPYFVMELVPGVPITQFCDDNGLSIRERLELVMDVCHAIQHAHTKGVIHRDLKPSNVLVTRHDERPVVKVIDFGIAKAIHGQAAGQTLHTEWRQFIGTPAYMSPEQAGLSHSDIDTRSDVYSLGVMLNELLTGITPGGLLEIQGRSQQELQRAICELEPSRPSDQVSSLAAIRLRSPRVGHGEPESGSSSIQYELGGIAERRKMAPFALRRMLRGDLDWIVMKCLEKERTRRYATPHELALDIGRFLASEPISAAPPSRTYRIRRLLRRHRGKAVAGLLIALSLLAAVTGTTIFAMREMHQRDIAQAQAAIASAVSRFQSEMFSSADPANLLGEKVTVYQAIQVAVRELDSGKLNDQPLVEAAVRRTIGNTLRALGQYDEALPNLRRAVELQREVLPVNEIELAASEHDLARLLYARGDSAEAEARATESLRLRERLLPTGHVDLAQSQSTRGALFYARGNYADAEPLLRTALRVQQASLPANHPDLGWTRNFLSVLLRDEGRFSEAERYCREILGVQRASLPPDHPEIAASLTFLAVVLAETRDPEKLVEAEQVAHESLVIRRRILAPGHPDTGRSLHSLAAALQLQGRHAEAQPLLEESLEINRNSLPPVHERTGRVLVNLGWTLFEQGKFDDAKVILSEAVDICRQAYAAGDPTFATAVLNLGRTLYAKGEPTDAEPLLRQSLDLFVRSFQETRHRAWSVHISIAQQTLAWLLRDQGRLDEAEPLLRSALSGLREARPAAKADQLSIVVDLLDVLDRGGRTADAAELRRETEAELPHPSWASNPPPAKMIKVLVRFYDAWHAGEPGAGYDERASAWREHLAAPASASPTSAPTN